MDFIISDLDAYDCALKFGKTNIAVYNIIAYLNCFIKLKKKSIDIEGILKSERRVQGRCQQSPESTPEYMPPIENTLFLGLHTTLSAILG